MVYLEFFRAVSDQTKNFSLVYHNNQSCEVNITPISIKYMGMRQNIHLVVFKVQNCLT